MERPWQAHLAEAWDDFRQLTVDVVYGRATGPWATLWGGFLWCLSLPFEGIARTRRWAYQHRLLRNHHLGCLVIVVGNLTVGGTGKTPVVEKFARSLAERGRRVAILSRGYKRKRRPLPERLWRKLSGAPEEPPKVVSDGRQVLLDSAEAGDEPYMLARNLPGVIVLVDKNRVKAGNYAIRKFGVDTLILDDGFQYLALAEHLHLLLIDKTNPFGNGHLLPRGILREPVDHLRRATHIFLTKSDGRPDPALEAIIRRHRPQGDWLECRHAPRYVQQVNGVARHELTWLAGRRIGALSAIAVPEGFENFLRQHGAQLEFRQRFLDHHRFSAEELADVFDEARHAEVEAILTTEKDAVRIPADFVPPVPFYFLRVEVEILSGGATFDDAVDRVCFPREWAARRAQATE